MVRTATVQVKPFDGLERTRVPRVPSDSHRDRRLTGVPHPARRCALLLELPRLAAAALALPAAAALALAAAALTRNFAAGASRFAEADCDRLLPALHLFA